MDHDIILNGIHIGEHSFKAENMIEELYERCVKPGYNFVTIRPFYMGRREELPSEYYIKWAKYLAENKIYFIFLYTIQFAPDGKDSHFTEELVAKIREVAGEYFLGDMIGETGSSFACKFAGYFNRKEGTGADPTVIKTDYPDMKAAHEGYIKDIERYIGIDKKLCMPKVAAVEATGLNKYNLEAGVDLPVLEMMCGNPDILVPALRGAARAYGADMWGTYVAHEWYGGMRHSDILKRKRLELTYKYAYLSGSSVFCLESGDEIVTAYGQRHEKESDVCNEYRKAMSDMTELIKRDARPKGGPRVKFAFVSGLHDAYGGWGGSSVWNQFGRSEWGHGEAEHSWRIAENVWQKRSWTDIANFGENDLSASPAYGMFDIVPIEAPIEKLSEYDYLVFLGWNSMTEENLDKLTEYVSRGGNLLMSAAHLNKSTLRGGEFDMPSEESLKKLFGARFTGEIVKTNDGVKFKFNSIADKRLYPGSGSLLCDPIYSAGYVEYAKFELCGGNDAAVVTGSFINDPSELPAVIENKVGNGTATLVTSVNYPGNPCLYPLYNAVVREMITESSRQSDIKVIGSDRVRWSVYEGDKIYILNTDYDMPVTVKVIKGKAAKTITIDSLELRTVEFEKEI